MRPDGLEDAPQLQIDIDRDKANALGVTFDAINAALSTALGSSYVNDFPNRGRLQRVVVQADAPARMQPEDLLKLNAPNCAGQAGAAVGLRDHALDHRRAADRSLQRLSGDAHHRRRGAGLQHGRGDGRDGAARGAAAGRLRLRMDRPVARRKARRLAGDILYGFAILAVFLCLAALYESWSIPLAVILVVPLGVLGALLATMLRGYSNDVYFQVGLITIIGLSAKNAILIIEFAKDLQAQGKGVVESALAAAHLRFRPIIMTSLAFILGVMPLAFATGAGSASQRAIGTGVLGGMVTGTALAVLFVPVFFVVVRGFFKGSARQHEGRQAARPGRRHRGDNMNKRFSTSALRGRAAGRADAGGLLADPDLRAARPRRCRRPSQRRRRRPARRPPPRSPGRTTSPIRALQRTDRQRAANNRDLRVAVLNIEQARAQFHIRRAASFPASALAPAARASARCERRH